MLIRPGLNGVGVPFSVTPSLTGVDKIVAVIVLHHITFISTWGITAPPLGGCGVAITQGPGPSLESQVHI